MSTKKGQAVSEEDLEKASGGRVEDTFKAEIPYWPYSWVPFYKVYNDTTNEFVEGFFTKEEAEAYDKKINGEK